MIFGPWKLLCRRRSSLKAHTSGIAHVERDAALAARVDGGVLVRPAARAIEGLRVHAAGRVVDGVALEADC